MIHTPRSTASTASAMSSAPRFVATILPLLLLVSLTLNTPGRAGEGEPEVDPEKAKLAQGIFEQVKPMLGGEKDEQALPFLEKVLTYDPTFYQAAYEIGKLHARQSRDAEAKAMYTKAKAMLEAKTGRTPLENTHLAELQGLLNELSKTVGALQKLRAEHGAKALAEAKALEEAKKPFGALRLYWLALDLDPENEEALAGYNRLRGELGPTLAEGASPRGWEYLITPKTKDLSDWRVRTGVWTLKEGVIEIKGHGGHLLSYRGPTRRNFILRAEVSLHWDDWWTYIFLVGRTQPNGGGYAFGLKLDQDKAQQPPLSGNWVVVREHREAEAFLRPAWGERTQRFYPQGRREDWPRLPVQLEPTRWYELELECRGPWIIGRIDGIEIFRREDTTFSEGGIALQVQGNNRQSQRIRNIRILELPDAYAPPKVELGEHPQDARPHGEHWYKRIDQRMDWQAAKAHCEALGGYLAVIENEAEANFVQEIAGDQPVWIGLSDHAQEGQWRWVNGKPLTYTRWAEGEPNNAGGAENYAGLFHDGRWNDFPEQEMLFVCEWEK